MAKGKKTLVGLLAVLIVAGIGVGIYVFYYGSKHKTEYGSKHKITKKEASLIDRFEVQMKKCAKDVFTHKKLPYKPPKGADKDGYAKAVGVVVKEIRVCLQGQKTADGKGFSPPNLQGKQLEPVVGAKDCAEFATKFVTMIACETRIEALVDDAGFVDPEGGDDEGGEAADGMAAKPDPMAAKKDDMAAKPDDMAAKKDDMAAKPDDMAAMKDDMAAKKDDMAAMKDDMAAKKDAMTPPKAMAPAMAMK